MFALVNENVVFARYRNYVLNMNTYDEEDRYLDDFGTADFLKFYLHIRGILNT